MQRPEFTPVILAFTSGKGGCGKTTVAVNFANTLVRGGAKVLLVDCDLSNRGSSGLFADDVASTSDCLSLARLLDPESDSTDSVPLSFERKPGFFFIPAGRPGDRQPRLKPGDYATVSEALRERLVGEAGRLEVDCVVLDCFSGVDVVTTASAIAADHVVIVNEPDLVTFTGTIHLLNHLDHVLVSIQRTVRRHLLINRVTSKFTVDELDDLYANNLQKSIPEAVICYLPFHERIFRGFGQHAFFTDLLPGSLFARKLQLLARRLFEGAREDLMPAEVRDWSDAKIRGLHRQIVDPACVDSEYLVLKFSGLPLFAGAWLLGSLLLLATPPFTAWAIWAKELVSMVVAGLILAVTLLPGFWYTARLNFTLAAYRWRYLRSASVSLPVLLVKTGIPLAGGAFIGTTLVAGTFAVGLLALQQLEWMFNVGAVTRRAADFSTRQTEVALRSAASRVDLSGTVVLGVNFESNDLGIGATTQGGLTTFQPFFGTPPVFVGGTTLVECVLNEAGLSGKRIADCEFRDCQFTGRSTFRIDLEGCKWSRVRLVNSPTISILAFQRSSFSRTTLALASGTFLSFDGCTLDDVVLERTTAKDDANRDENESKVTVTFGESDEVPAGVRKAKGVRVVDQSRWSLETLKQSLAKNISDLEEKIAVAIRRKSLNRGTLIDEIIRFTERGNLREQIRRQVLDLVQLYLLSGDRSLFDGASRIIEALGRTINGDDDEGTVRLLRMLAAVIGSPSLEAAGYESDDFARWMEQHPDFRSDWTTWEQNFNPLAFSQPQIQALDAIRNLTERVWSMSLFKNVFYEAARTEQAPRSRSRK